MGPNLFNVIYTGRLLDGFVTEEVIKDFSNKFKIPEAKAIKVINANKEVVLKPRTEHVKAYKFKSVLESIGMDVRLETAAAFVPQNDVDHPSSPELPVEQTVTQPTEQPEDSRPSDIQNTDSTAWSLEPLETETEDKEEKEPQPTVNVHPAYQKKEKTTEQAEPKAESAAVNEQPNLTEIKAETPNDSPGLFAQVTKSVKKVGDYFKSLKSHE